jgi:hypothetical protein
MFRHDTAKIDLLTQFPNYGNYFILSFTKNQQADADETAMRFDPDWKELIDPNGSNTI